MKDTKIRLDVSLPDQLRDLAAVLESDGYEQYGKICRESAERMSWLSYELVKATYR